MQIPGYRIIRKISQGGMSTVYLATQLSVGRQVALKVMSPVLNADPVFSERFQREANIVGQLPHPNIVSIYDIGRYKSLNYIAMDYLPGGTVHDRMREGLSTAEVLRITKEVARALDVAHNKGYVHRDIKPENILFREDGTTVLSDFGVAKTISTAARVTNAGTVVGTPHYMSPEQSRGQALDGRADIYSLGIVFYEMLTGAVPFQADDAVAIAVKHLTAPVPTLPPQYTLLQTLVNRFLAKEPDQRFQRGQEIVEAIEQVEGTLAGRPNRGTPATDTEMNVMVLFKALLLTSYAVIKAGLVNALRKIMRWRWTPKRGFYRRPTVKVTEIRHHADTGEDERETVISTRIQKAAHYQELGPRKLSFVTRALAMVFVVTSIWSALSVGLQRFDVPTDELLPTGMHSAIVSTAAVMEGYAAYWTGGNGAGDEALAAADDSNARQGDAGSGGAALAATQIDTVQGLDPGSVNAPTATAQADDTEAAQAQPQENDEPAPPPVVEPTYALRVNAQPEDARIRILNIRERFHQGIDLKAGRYHIEVSKPGYHTLKRWERIRGRDVTLDYTLRAVYDAGDSLNHELADGGSGPQMVVLPRGTFTMGNDDHDHTAPAHQVAIDYRIAMSKYEITFADFNRFADATDIGLPADNGWGMGTRPVIHVNWREAKAYAEWLSEQTGHHYRLPTEAEWEYAARAGTNTHHWWGDGGARGYANCKRGCDSDYTGFFSSRTAPAGSFPANDFRLHDTAGNVAEWVQDCYRPHYRNAPADGSARSADNCDQRVVRGGAMGDSYRKLYTFERKGVAPATRSDEIGFRLVVELENR